MLDQEKADAVRIAKAAIGGGTALADALGIRAPSIAGWTQIPAERVLHIEKITGVSRHILRPDLYPVDNLSPLEKNRQAVTAGGPAEGRGIGGGAAADLAPSDASTVETLAPPLSD